MREIAHHICVLYTIPFLPRQKSMDKQPSSHTQNCTYFLSPRLSHRIVFQDSVFCFYFHPYFHLPLCYLLHIKLSVRDLLARNPRNKLGISQSFSVCTYLGLQRVQQRENGKEPTQSISHMLLHHLPPNAQADESHQAERLETDGSASLHPAGEPEYSRAEDECHIY